LIDELGDVLWYLQALVDETDIDLNEVAVRNIEKLKKRKSDNNLKHE
jgi:NTP pyrophosphatase (non-canonical NTP hydrolase)